MKNNSAILLVEDNHKDEILAKRAFKKSKLKNHVIVARDGVEALEYLFPRENGENNLSEMPTAVFLDLKLPRIDGFEVLRRIRSAKQTRYLPVIVLTSSDEERDIISSYQLGANSYVRKPMDSNDFTKAVSAVGIYWAEINERPPEGIPGG